MLKLRRIVAGSLHLWKGEMKIARMAPFSSSAENGQMATAMSNKHSMSNKQIATDNSIFEKLQCLISETLDFIMREEEKKKGVSVTKSDLVGWAEQLDKEGKHEYALEIFEWMDKKMVFSPSEHAVFVDLLAKSKGFVAARDYFYKLDPDFKESDRNPKSWPAFLMLIKWRNVGDKRSMARPLVRLFSNGVRVNFNDY